MQTLTDGILIFRFQKFGKLSEISGSHSEEYEDDCILGRSLIEIYRRNPLDNDTITTFLKVW